MFDVEVTGAVAVIRLNNPPVNVVSFGNWRRLPGLLAELEQRPDLHAVVFTGLPQRHFCGGNDTREFAGLTPRDTELGTRAVRDSMRATRESRLVAVAALHGAAMGSGFMLACACDLRVADRAARMGLPEVRAGAFGGYRIVREVMPAGEARWITYTGRPISAERAWQIGLVQELAETPEETLGKAMALATEITGLLAQRYEGAVKPLLDRLDRSDLWDGYDLERLLAMRIMGEISA